MAASEIPRSKARCLSSGKVKPAIKNFATTNPPSIRSVWVV